MSETNLLTDPAFWVLISFGIFLALAFRPLARMLNKALDARSARIQTELEEAIRLREEAQEALAVYQQKQQECLKEAEAMLEQAKKDAEKLAAKAEQELKDALESRKKLALEKIAQSEAKALQEVQHHVVEISIAAAKLILLEQIEKASGDDSIKAAIADIERKLH